MALNVSTLRPGYLVSLKTSVRGNVSYDKIVLDVDETADGSEKRRWETTRTIVDPAEHERAQKARTAASASIRRVCTQSAFGLLCPETEGDKLDAAIKQARAIVSTFNESAQLSRIAVYVIAGKIAADDVEAVKAINSEIRDLLAEMEEGLANLDVAKVRAAASKAKSVANMLSPESAARVQLAVDAARASATQLVKAGEQAAAEVDRATIRRIAEQRTAFLDLDEMQEIKAVTEQGRALDLPVA